jgi:hypothetical protein
MKRISIFLLLLTAIWLAGCGAPASTLTPLSVTQLKYILMDYFGGMAVDHGILYCDPDRYPLQIDDQEHKNALEKFVQIAKMPIGFK